MISDMMDYYMNYLLLLFPGKERGECSERSGSCDLYHYEYFKSKKFLNGHEDREPLGGGDLREESPTGIAFS